MQYLGDSTTELQMRTKNVLIPVRPGMYKPCGWLFDLHDRQLPSLSKE